MLECDESVRDGDGFGVGIYLVAGMAEVQTKYSAEDFPFGG